MPIGVKLCDNLMASDTNDFSRNLKKSRKTITKSLKNLEDLAHNMEK